MPTRVRSAASDKLRQTGAIRHVLMDRVEHQALVAQALQFAFDLGRIAVPVRPIQPPTQFSLAQWQTPFRNQGGRGTCWAFAGAAALEAAYHRQLGHPIGASEEYVYHVGRTCRVEPGQRTEYPCSLWNNQGAANVVAIMSHDAICGRDMVHPYVPDQAEMNAMATALGMTSDLAVITPREADLFEFSDLHIPLLARVNARYRVADWAAIRANVPDVKSVLLSGHEVVCDYSIGHVLLVIGYDDARQVFIAKNSWGETSFVEIAYENDPRFGTMIGAPHYIKSVVDPTLVQNDACWLGRWHTTINGLPFEVFIRRHSPLPGYAGDSLGAASSPLGDHAIHGAFTNNGITATLHIDRSVAVIPPRFPFDFGQPDGITTLVVSLDHADPYVATGHASGAFTAEIVMTRFEQRYAALWETNDGTAWRGFHGTPSAAYQGLFDAQTADSLRLTGIQGAAQGIGAEIASIWRQSDGTGWTAFHGQSSDEYQLTFDQCAAQNLRLVSITGYAERGQARFASLWTPSDGRRWKARHGMDTASFQAEFDRALAEGLVLGQVSGYRVGIERRFVALWEFVPGEDYSARHGLTEDELKVANSEHTARGQNLSWISAWPDTGRPRFAAIWTSRAPVTTLQLRQSRDQYQAKFDEFGNAGLRLRCALSYESGV